MRARTHARPFSGQEGHCAPQHEPTPSGFAEAIRHFEASLVRPAFVLLLLAPLCAGAADLYNGTPTAIVEPACIEDAASSLFAGGAPPEDRFMLVVRHMGDDALLVSTSVDFGALGAIPLTNLHVPAPRESWQRARTAEDPNFTSAFQVHCADAGLFINAWRFAPEELIDEGPHAAYGFVFSDPPPAFDGNPGTDLVIQAELEVPWVYKPEGSGVALTYFQIRFYDTTTGRFLQMTMLLHDTDGVDFVPYADYARNDSLFVAAPATTTAVVTRSPYSAAPSGRPWTGLRFFRSQITPANFRAAIALANSFCARRPDVPDCAILPGSAAPLSETPEDYRIAEFALITELFNADTDRNGLSVGLHVRALGLYNFR